MRQAVPLLVSLALTACSTTDDVEPWWVGRDDGGARDGESDPGHPDSGFDDGGSGPCDPAVCDATCRWIGMPGGACVADECRCGAGGSDADGDADGGPPPCDPVTCDEACRSAGATSGSCAGGGCFCDIPAPDGDADAEVDAGGDVDADAGADSGPDPCASAPEMSAPTVCDGPGGRTSTERSPSGFYATSWFGCYYGTAGEIVQDPGDNCEFACGSRGLCDASLDGPTCEAELRWFAANADRFGCGGRIRVTNCANGRSVVLVTLDRGPNCATVEQPCDAATLDMSHPAMEYLFEGRYYGACDRVPVHVELVDASTPLGPV